MADTLALLLFFTATGVINERMIAAMSWEQIFNARLLGAVLMIPVARPYGIWRDFLMRRASDKQLSRLFWNSSALITFQVPIYAAILALSGAQSASLLSGTLGATVMRLVLGPPYGAFLNWVRSCFGLPKGE
ncbi:L-alanine exporter AlaE [Rhizobium wenxiniae]|uniref:L-alanine exporter AlaE n=1 Tax=Rhizobium wenxiniae TaxID=1737357 RepID=UPI0021D45BC6|nr:L-alanine exporter AlaE [Rhizobium wenxiniae]